MSKLGERLKKGWNAFMGRDPTPKNYSYMGYGYRQDRRRLSSNNIRTIVNYIYNQIAVDVSTMDINHVRLNDKNQYLETIDDPLNQCLTVSANLDQTGRDLLRDVVLTMFDKGVAAIVPVDTDKDPRKTDSYNIYSLRVGEIIQWAPKHVLVSVYNEETGKREDVWLEKRIVAIVENPFYSTMNERNSTAQRLIKTLNQIDSVNDELSLGKLDLIVQLPYAVKNETRRKEAEKRRADIEAQLRGSKYGVAYTDGTERIVQLNRSLENNLWTQVKDLTTQLYNQLGFSETIFNGTAKEEDMLNYNNRTVNPVVAAIVEEMHRKFLSVTARTQKQAIRCYKDPFRLVPVNQIAEIADKFTRNEIMTSNEIRSAIGLKPSTEPKADELRNSNLNQPIDQMIPTDDSGTEELDPTYEEGTNTEELDPIYENGYEEGYSAGYEDAINEFQNE